MLFSFCKYKLISSNRFVYFQTIRNFVCYYNEQGSYSLRNLT